VGLPHYPSEKQYYQSLPRLHRGSSQQRPTQPLTKPLANMWSGHDERHRSENSSAGKLPYRMLDSGSTDSSNLNNERQLSKSTAGKLPYRMLNTSTSPADSTELNNSPQPYISQHANTRCSQPNNRPYHEPSSLQTQQDFPRFNNLLIPPHDMRRGSLSLPGHDDYFGFRDVNWEDLDHNHIVQGTPTGGGVWNSNIGLVVPSNAMAHVFNDIVPPRDDFNIDPRFLLPQLNINTSQQLQEDYHSSQLHSPKHTSNPSPTPTHTSTPSSSSKATLQPAWGGSRQTRRTSAIANSTSNTNNTSNSSRQTRKMQRNPAVTSPSSAADGSSSSTVQPPTEKAIDGRTQHNMIERQYRSRLNGQFETLLQILPSSMRELTARNPNGLIDTRSLGKNVSKAEVLVMAIQYIQELENKGKQLGEDNERLTAHTQRLESNWVNAGGMLMP